MPNTIYSGSSDVVKTSKNKGFKEGGVLKKAVVLFIILSSLSLAESVTDMEKKVKNIEKQIQVKNTRIKTIDVEKHRLEKQIEDISKEMVEIDRERQKILEEIKTVSKNIDYGTRNLGITSSELERKRLEFKAKIIAWNRYSKEKEQLLDKQSPLKRNFVNLLYGDLRKMEYIKNVETDIKKVKRDIEKEKVKLGELRNKLARNIYQMDSKKAQQNRLIAQLNREKSTHVRNISQLQKEKKRIEEKIKQIIKARTKTDKKVVNTSQAYSKLGKVIKPVDGPIVVRFNQKKQQQVTSNGIEITARMGAKVKSSAKGKVIYADAFQGLGKVVMIDYGYNMIGVYGNLIATNVKINQQVQQGAEIGTLGLSVEGKPNLYYELRFNLKPIDPVPMF